MRTTVRLTASLARAPRRVHGTPRHAARPPGRSARAPTRCATIEDHTSIRFDHLAIAATDRERSAAFLTELLGLPEPTAWGPFLSVHLEDGVHLDYAEPGVDFPPQHYALLVSDDVFDAALERIHTRGLPHSAGPGGPADEINHHHGGRGVYLDDPDGHHFELITQPYGADLA